MGQYYDGGGGGVLNNVSEAPDNCTGQCAQFVAFLRGFGWSTTTAAGVFALHLGEGRSDAGSGFRCAGP
jgi:hypothetical protein